MSHFSVLVIGDDVTKLLAPFQENNMEDCPKEFMEFYSKEEEIKKEYEENLIDCFVPPGGEGPKCKYDPQFRLAHYSGYICPVGGTEQKILANKVYPTLEEYAAKYCGYGTRDPEKNEFGYWENPNKKWDWWVVGGRFDGQLVNKLGTRVNSLLVKELDIEALKKEKAIDLGQCWDEHSGKPEAVFYKITPNMSREEYINKYAKFSTFAVVKDSKWYERGQMGWWAFVSNEMSAEEWDTKFEELLSGLSPETKLTIVDCHI